MHAPEALTAERQVFVTGTDTGVGKTLVSAVLARAWSARWAWSWPVWIAVNAVQAAYFWHAGYWVLFGLQFVLAAMSVVGWREWRRDERREVAFA